MKHVRRLPVKDVATAKEVMSRLNGTRNAYSIWGRPQGYWVIREVRHLSGELLIAVEPHDGKPALLTVRVDKPLWRRAAEFLGLARARRPTFRRVEVALPLRDWGEIAGAEKVEEAQS